MGVGHYCANTKNWDSTNAPKRCCVIVRDLEAYVRRLDCSSHTDGSWSVGPGTETFKEMENF